MKLTYPKYTMDHIKYVVRTANVTREELKAAYDEFTVDELCQLLNLNLQELYLLLRYHKVQQHQRGITRRRHNKHYLNPKTHRMFYEGEVSSSK